MKDLQPRSISKIIAKFQPSVIEKMKVSFLLSHLLQYYVLIDSEKFELAGTVWLSIKIIPRQYTIFEQICIGPNNGQEQASMQLLLLLEIWKASLIKMLSFLIILSRSFTFIHQWNPSIMDTIDQ